MIAIRLITALSTLLIGACASLPSPQVTVMFGPRVAEGEKDLGATLQVLQKFGHDTPAACALDHGSVTNKGYPFNEREEITFDQIGCGFQWGGK
jgi:hypothetical protein